MHEEEGEQGEAKPTAAAVAVSEYELPAPVAVASAAAAVVKHLDVMSRAVVHPGPAIKTETAAPAVVAAEADTGVEEDELVSQAQMVRDYYGVMCTHRPVRH